MEAYWDGMKPQAPRVKESAPGKEKPMLKTIAWSALGPPLALPPVSAVAQTGYGVINGAPSTTTFDRSWNHFNESKERARASAAYVRRHGEPWYYHHPHHHDPNHP